MKSPTIVLDIARRTATFTLATVSVLGAVYGALLFLAYLFSRPINSTGSGGGGPDLFNWDGDFYLVDLIWAVPFGTVLAVFIIVIIAVTGGMVGGFVGAMMGGISGAASGLVTGALAATGFFPTTYDNVPRFRAIISAVGVVFAAPVAYMLGPEAFRLFAPSNASADSPGMWVMQALLPALLAGVGALWAGIRVTPWYEAESRQPSLGTLEQRVQ